MWKYYSLSCRVYERKRIIRFVIKKFIIHICINNHVGTGARNVMRFMRMCLNLIEVFENRMKL